MFGRITRRWCCLYSIPPGDLWLLTHPDEALEYELLANENTIPGEIVR